MNFASTSDSYFASGKAPAICQDAVVPASKVISTKINVVVLVVIILLIGQGAGMT